LVVPVTWPLVTVGVDLGGAVDSVDLITRADVRGGRLSGGGRRRGGGHDVTVGVACGATIRPVVGGFQIPWVATGGGRIGTREKHHGRGGAAGGGCGGGASGGGLG
jgi:hypothetical protein